MEIPAGHESICGSRSGTRVEIWKYRMASKYGSIAEP